MRRFEGSDGQPWDVVIGRESWGGVVALFVPVGRDSVVRQTALTASSQEAASAEIDALTNAGLQSLLARSTIKES